MRWEGSRVDSHPFVREVDALQIAADLESEQKTVDRLLRLDAKQLVVVDKSARLPWAGAVGQAARS